MRIVEDMKKSSVMKGNAIAEFTLETNLENALNINAIQQLNLIIYLPMSAIISQ